MRNELPQEESLELIAVADPAEAKMIEEMLNQNNIKCVLQGDVTAILPAGDLDDIQIFVDSENAESARELVEAFFTPVEKGELEDGESDLGV